LEANSKGSTYPAVKETVSDEVADRKVEEEALDAADARRFRALAARANYLAMDRLDVQFAAKEVCRDMANPKKSSWAKLKRLGRYLLECPALVWSFDGLGGQEPLVLDVYSDSDWAGCRRTRRSTSGGVMLFDGAVVKTWSSTQASVATSSGDAEFYALTKAAAEGLGMQAVAQDLGIGILVRVWVDSSAAKAMASRTGLGRTRHVEVRFLWVQEALKQKRFEIRKVWGKLNPADVATKSVAASEIEEHLKMLGGKLIRRAKADDVGSQNLSDCRKGTCRCCTEHSRRP
jgi:hypothetical protein